MVIQPKLKWYTEISARKNTPPRCPYAYVYRCPRYYQSVSLLGEGGMTTKIEAEEDKRLLEQWKGSDLWPVVAEQKTSISGWEGRQGSFDKFCPEVSFERFGWFASFLARYADEIDSDAADRRLAKEGAPPGDWRWSWWFVTEMHYTDCPLYSALILGVNDKKRSVPIGFTGKS